MGNRKTILWRLAVLGLFASLVPLGFHALERNGEVDTESMLDASVSIRTTSHVTIDKFGDSVWDVNNGSGFLVSEANCEVWTNHHVVAGAALIEVFPRGWNRTAGIEAKLINSTPRSDIAILELEQCEGLKQARLGDSDLVQPGDESYAVGNPLGRNPDSISRGIISHTRRIRESDTPYLQTDAAINPGNSGGALFDREGRVIGVNTAIDSTRYGANVGIGYAVPINRVMQTVAELRRGPPSWGDAGITDIVASLSADEAEVFDIPVAGGALVVTRSPEEGPSAGKLQEHDVIYRINDLEIENAKQAIRAIGQQGVGDLLELELIREGVQQRVEIVLGEGWKADSEPAPDEYEGYLGMTVEMWNDKDGDYGKFKQPVITRVASLGPAHKARISSSQNSIAMNGPFVVPYLLDVKTVTGVAYEGKFHTISDVEELETFAARAYREGKPLLLEIEFWARANPLNRKDELRHESTAFFKLKPERAIAVGDSPGHKAVVERGDPHLRGGFSDG
jgi:serine protease Do